MLKAVTANQAYRMYLGADGDNTTTNTPKLSFKDWIAQQKLNGNVDKYGKLILDKFFGNNTNGDNTTQNNTMNDNSSTPNTNTPVSTAQTTTDITPKPSTSFKISPWIYVPLIIGAIGTTIWLINRYQKKDSGK